MATEYEVIDRDWMRGQGALGGVGGILFLLLCGVASQWLLGLALAALVWLLVLAYVVDLVQRVRVTEAGAVEFVRLRGVRRVPAGSVRSIEGRMARDEDGGVSWWIRVRLARGRVELQCFGDAAALVADVRRLNPAVAVSGKWPLGLAAPDDPSLGLRGASVPNSTRVSDR